MNTMLAEAPRVAEMRGAFDQAFAAPAVKEGGERISLIAIRLAGEPLALRADQIAGIAKRRRIVSVPSRVPELMGITGMRGALVPVFSLAALLGLARSEECVWLALAHRESPVALAFDQFEGQIEMPRTCLYDDATAPPRRHVRQLARVASGVRAVVDIPSLIKEIRRAAESSRS